MDKKTPPLGVWLQCKEGNMPEDYGYENFGGTYITNSVIVPCASYSFIEGHCAKYIDVSRIKSKGHTRWHWFPKIDPPLFWMAIPQNFDTSHIDKCDSLDEILRVVNGLEPPNSMWIYKDELARWKTLYFDLADNASQSEEKQFYFGKVDFINYLLKLMEKQ